MADANKYAPILSKAQQKGPLAIGLILVIVIISIVVSVLILPSFNEDTPKPAAPIKPASTPAPAPPPKPAAPQPPPQPLRETPAKRLVPIYRVQQCRQWEDVREKVLILQKIERMLICRHRPR